MALGMANASDSLLRQIRTRRQEIARDLAGFEQQVERLRAEDERLEIAEEVYVEMHGGTPPAPAPRKFKVLRKGKATRPKSGTKPAGIPTTPEMIVAALKDAGTRQLPGLRPEEIRDFIRDKWWPDVHIDAVGPTAWRMAKEGKLARSDGLYLCPKNETPAGGTAGVSRSGPAVNGSDGPPSPLDTRAQREGGGASWPK